MAVKQMRYFIMLLVIAASMNVLGGTERPRLPKHVDGIPVALYSNTVCTMMSQLPTNAGILKIVFFTSNETVVVTTTEPSGNETNQFDHVFIRQTREYSDIVPLNKRLQSKGVTQEDVTEVASHIEVMIPKDEKVLLLEMSDPTVVRHRNITENEGCVDIKTRYLIHHLRGMGRFYTCIKKQGQWMGRASGEWTN